MQNRQGLCECLTIRGKYVVMDQMVAQNLQTDYERSKLTLKGNTQVGE